jgi:hypothetical protein
VHDKPQIIFNPIYYRLEAEQIAPFLGAGMELIVVPGSAVLLGKKSALHRACARLNVDVLVDHLIHLPGDAKHLYRNATSDPLLNVLEMATDNVPFRMGLSDTISRLVEAIDKNKEGYFKQCSDVLTHYLNIELAHAPRNSPEAIVRLRMYPQYYIDNQQDGLPARSIQKIEQEIEKLPPLLRRYHEKELIDIAIQPSYASSQLLPAIRTVVIGTLALDLETPKHKSSLPQSMLREGLRRSGDVAIGFSKSPEWIAACEEQMRHGLTDAENFLKATRSAPKATLEEYKESGWPIAAEMLANYFYAKDELESMHSRAGCGNPLSWVMMVKGKETHIDSNLAKLFPEVHHLAKDFEPQLEAYLNQKHGRPKSVKGRG